jgi:hypothetical protein
MSLGHRPRATKFGEWCELHLNGHEHMHTQRGGGRGGEEGGAGGAVRTRQGAHTQGPRQTSVHMITHGCTKHEDDVVLERRFNRTAQYQQFEPFSSPEFEPFSSPESIAHDKRASDRV